ncbi:hypothetical protein, partial [Enterobacter hormaechei]|uniref:hypothetical protein n=1 Tax=Enterobacter hormaechei TaxID=158836 RepID=UPI00203B97FA
VFRLSATSDVRSLARHRLISNASGQEDDPFVKTALSAVFFTSHRFYSQINRLFLHHYHPVNGSVRNLTHG